MPGWISYVDVAIAVIIFLFAWGGSQKGFAAQLAHILTFVLCGVLLFFAYPAATGYFSRIFRDMNATYMMWLLLAALAVLAVLSFIFINKMLAGLIKLQMTDKADAINGFILGALRGTLGVFLAMTLLVLLGSDRIYEAFTAKSKVGQLVCREFVPRIQPHVNRSVVQEKVDSARDSMWQRKGEDLEE